MPRTGNTSVPPLDERIGRALLRGREDEGVVAVEDGRIVACTAYAAQLLGCDAQAALGRDMDAVLAESDSQLLQLHFRSALLEEESVEFVTPRPRSADEWIKVRSLPLSPGFAFLIKDVTDRELSDRTLRRKERRLLATNLSLRLAHTAAHAASWEWRKGGPLRWLDLAAARDLVCLPPAWTEDEVFHDWRRLAAETGRLTFRRAMQRLVDAGLVSFEIEVVGADDARHWLRIDCAVTERDAGGAPTRVSGVNVDVTEQKLAAVALRGEVEQRKRSEARQQLLVQELNHRVKNMLATVQSVARQTLASAELTGPAHEFEDRLMALAWAYEILTRENWGGASLRELVSRTTSPHANDASGRIAQDGPDLWLTPNRALSLALALHELTTNAVKYGALSNTDGRVDVRWHVSGPDEARSLELEWVEHGGPPVVAPQRRGFGSRLIEHSLARELDGEATLSFEPTGLRCGMLSRLADEQPRL